MDLDKKINHNRFKIDLLLNGFNFSGGLLALSSLKSGLKIAIKIPYPFEKEFYPELSSFYPMTVVDSLQSLNDFNFFLKCSSLFPNHFFPQRVLSFNNNETYNGTFNNAFDKLLKRDRESSTLPIKTAKYKAYQNISNIYRKGALVYEYRFDRNRAIIDLLKLCVANGATVVKNKTKVDCRLEIKCNPIKRNDFLIEIENFKWPYPNCVRVEKNSFCITFQSFGDKTIVQFYLKSNEIKFDEFEIDIFEIFVNYGLPKSEKLQYQLREIFLENARPNNLNIQDFTDPKLFNLCNETLNLIKKVSSHFGQKLYFNKAFLVHRGNEMKNENFRLIQNMCDEKFDLAKQTGISYDRFILFYYRYRNHIDNMIESAYEMMNNERDPEIIWNRVEADFLRDELLYLR